jgi:hypothetical protein
MCFPRFGGVKSILFNGLALEEPLTEQAEAKKARTQ